ncbi:MAG: histidinol dehydrogenase, partial [Lentimicrobium sp.]|nr:histidinol dehydrogenase [Lentimicrobium sp.]
MNTILNPRYSEWEALCKRPALSAENLEEKVKNIIERVQLEGDRALKEFTFLFDKVNPEILKVSDSEIEAATLQVPEELKEALAIAARNIRTFHATQKSMEPPIETMPGITCWRKSVAIENVGLYIPGGSAPLFSTILMLAIPATIAGCKRIVLCTPPDKSGNINPAVLYTAYFLGIKEIFRVGGAQAIAALAYGTESIPRVDKIF